LYAFKQGWRKTAEVHDFDDGSCVVAVSCEDRRSCRRVWSSPCLFEV